MERKGFLTAGTWCLDRNMTIDGWPREDTVGVVTGIELSGGGNGCNFACDMARLDPTVPLETQGIVGNDAAGSFLRQVCRDYGMDPDGLKVLADAQTMTTDAYQSTASGQRTHILTPGTANVLTPDHFDFSVTSARFLHLGLPGIHPVMDAPWGDDPNGWVTVLRCARAEGLETDMELVTIAPERLRAIVAPCLPYLSALVVNDFEIGAITGVGTIHEGRTLVDGVKAAARAALGQGAMDVVVVHFTMGAVLVRRGGAAIHVPSVDLPESAIVGANGAGDAFSAGFFYGLHSGWDDADCLRMAHAAAAQSLTGLGTYTAMKSADVCLARAEARGWRSA